MTYSVFPKYAQFLLENHLEEFTHFNIEKARESGIPMLKLFKSYSQEEFYQFLHNSLKSFLSSVSENKGLERINDTNRLLKQDRLPGIPAKEIEVTDVVQVHSLRKTALIFWLRRYTNELDVYERLINEIEDFYVQVQESTFTTFVEIQQDVLLKEKELTETVLNASFNSVVALETVRDDSGAVIDFKYALLNDVAEKMLNRTKHFMLGKTVLEVFPSMIKEGIFDLYKKTVETGEGFSMEFYYPYEGLSNWLKQAAIKWKDGLVVTTIDITPIKQSQQELEIANEQLKQSEEKLRSVNQRLEEKIIERTQDLVNINKDLELTKERFELLSKATNDAIWDWDLVGGKIWWSQGLSSMFGYSEEDTNDDSSFWISRIHPEDRVRVETSIKKVISSGKPNWEESYRYRHKNGTYRYIYDRGFTVINDAGAAVRMVGAMLDMTDKRLVEQKLHQATITLQHNENQLKVITNSLPAFISYVDADLTYRYINNYYFRLKGVDSDIIGKKVSDVLGEKWFKKALPHIEKVLGGQEVAFFNKFSLKNGQPVEVDTKYVPDKDNNGNVAGFVVLGIDLTERLQFERMLEQRNQELAKINADLDNFIYTASHDLRAPVSNIEGLITTLEESLKEECATDEIVQSVLSMMHISTDKFRGTIQDLTEISKVQRRIGDEKEDISLPDLLEDVKYAIQDIIEASGARIHADFSEAENVRFSRKNLKSIIYNLVSNAIKYAREDQQPEVDISTRYVDHQLELTVRDNGMGIAAEQKDKIFTMFKRFHTHVEGTGVGLYIVKRIVDNAGGSIDLKSNPGKGSIFRIFLPVK